MNAISNILLMSFLENRPMSDFQTGHEHTMSITSHVCFLNLAMIDFQREHVWHKNISAFLIRLLSFYARAAGKNLIYKPSSYRFSYLLSPRSGKTFESVSLSLTGFLNFSARAAGKFFTM